MVANFLCVIRWGVRFFGGRLHGVGGSPDFVLGNLGAEVRVRMNKVLATRYKVLTHLARLDGVDISMSRSNWQSLALDLANVGPACNASCFSRCFKAALCIRSSFPRPWFHIQLVILHAGRMSQVVVIQSSPKLAAIVKYSNVCFACFCMALSRRAC